jgi:RNA polymerase sigma factor (sigma-70 family)
MCFDRPLTGAELRDNLEGFTVEIHRVVIRRLGRTDALSDIVQEVHARLLQIDEAKLIEKPVGYVHRITHNVVFDLTRRGNNGFNHDAVPIETITPSDLDEQSSLQVADSSDGLNLQQQIALALGALSVERAGVIICIKVQGMSYEQAAEHLGLTLGQVRHHIVEAHKLLKNFPVDR